MTAGQWVIMFGCGAVLGVPTVIVFAILYVVGLAGDSDG